MGSSERSLVWEDETREEILEFFSESVPELASHHATAAALAAEQRQPVTDNRGK